jgi:hypothetical protein
MLSSCSGVKDKKQHLSLEALPKKGADRKTFGGRTWQKIILIVVVANESYYHPQPLVFITFYLLSTLYI